MLSVNNVIKKRCFTHSFRFIIARSEEQHLQTTVKFMENQFIVKI